MKKQMELIQRVLLEKRGQGSGVRSQWSGETIWLDIIGAIGMTGYLVLVIGHML